MGLLDNIGENQLLNMGLGILSNNQGNYGAFGPAVGRGALQGIQATQQAMQLAQMRKLAELQMKKAQLEMEQEKKKQEEEDAFKAEITSAWTPPSSIANMSFMDANNQAMAGQEPDYQITETPGKFDFNKAMPAMLKYSPKTAIDLYQSVNKNKKVHSVQDYLRDRNSGAVGQFLVLDDGTQIELTGKDKPVKLETSDLGGKVVSRNPFVPFNENKTIAPSFHQFDTDNQIAGGIVDSSGFNPSVILDKGISPSALLADKRAREANQLKRDEIALGGKAPPGYKWNPDGTMSAIVGGPADIKAGEAGKKEEAKKESRTRTANTVINKIDSVIDRISGITAGLGGAALGVVPGSEAYNLKSDLDTIKANFGFDRLQEMRDQSPTGGALGQVAIQELSMLQASVASLDPKQSPEQLKTNLEQARTHYNNWLETVGQEPITKPSREKTGKITRKPMKGQKVDGYTFKGGDPSNPTNWEKN